MVKVISSYEEESGDILTIFGTEEELSKLQKASEEAESSRTGLAVSTMDALEVRIFRMISNG